MTTQQNPDNNTQIIDPAIHAISISDHVLISITFLAEHQPLPPPR